MKKNNAWNIRCLVDESNQPSVLMYYIEDCRICSSLEGFKLNHIELPTQVLAEEVAALLIAHPLLGSHLRPC